MPFFRPRRPSAEANGNGLKMKNPIAGRSSAEANGNGLK